MYASITASRLWVLEAAVLTSSYAKLALSKCRPRTHCSQHSICAKLLVNHIETVNPILIMLLYFQVLTLEAEEGALCLAAVLVGDKPLVVCSKECIFIGACSGILGCM